MVNTLPFADTEVAVPGFGAMSFSHVFGPASDDESLKTLARAVEIGSTFWDTAAVYGLGHNESLIGRFFKENPEARNKVFLASKCGFDIDFEKKINSGVCNTPEHIKSTLDSSIARLGTTPDLYYLHRIDTSVPLSVSIPALDAQRKEGKCKYIGLSECSERTLREACSFAQIHALQVELSPWTTDHIDSGLIAAARELNVAVVAFAPLGSGFLSGKYRHQSDFAENDLRRSQPRFSEENMPKNLRIVDALEALAAKKGCTSSQLALAWVIRQGAVPIPGTRYAGRLEENFSAGTVLLSEEEARDLDKLVEEAKPEGARYNETIMSAMNK